MEFPPSYWWLLVTLVQASWVTFNCQILNRFWTIRPLMIEKEGYGKLLGPLYTEKCLGIPAWCLDIIGLAQPPNSRTSDTPANSSSTILGLYCSHTFNFSCPPPRVPADISSASLERWLSQVTPQSSGRICVSSMWPRARLVLISSLSQWPWKTDLSLFALSD